MLCPGVILRMGEGGVDRRTDEASLAGLSSKVGGTGGRASLMSVSIQTNALPDRTRSD